MDEQIVHSMFDIPTAYRCGKERHNQSLTTTSITFPPLGDKIARHHLWCEEIDNQKGKFIEKFLIEEDLNLPNNI